MIPLLLCLFVSGGGDGTKIQLEADKSVLLPDVPFQLTITVEGAPDGTEVRLSGIEKDGKPVFSAVLSGGTAVLDKVVTHGQATAQPGMAEIRADIGDSSETISIRVIPGWLCLLPALLAILLAIVTREVLVSLFAGVWAGGLIVLGFGPEELLLSALRALDTTIVEALTDPSNMKIVLFTLIMGGMVGVMSKSGGTRGIVDVVSKFAKTPRSGMISTWVMGLTIFFDDYANCMIIGSTMRPLTDRLKISREKLAYIVDSTAAPVATLSVISTWVVAKMGFVVQTGKVQESEMFSLFLELIPYSFYSLFTLFFVFLVAVSRRDFGPMRKAENRALETGAVLRPGATPLSDAETSLEKQESDMSRRWHVAAVPVVALVTFTILGLVLTGRQALGDAAETAGFWKVMGNADSFNAILWGAMGGSVLALVLAMLGGHLTPRKSIEAWVGGCKGMLTAVLVLTLAWSIAATCRELSTGEWVIARIGDDLPLKWLPVITFVVSALVAFATGTSWGTMAILVPIIVPWAWTSPEDGIRLASLAGVLSGAIFGDHCSPISDTTVMSSLATASDHIDHVRTQLPYGLLCGGVAIFIGFIPVGFGLPPWVSLIVGAALLVATLLLLGRKPRTA